ncbi:MAG: DUF3604 domain-containing protein, partial [Myxococcota bacterium]
QADACDFARYCSALDFWSINDHAEGMTPRHWRETVEAIRQCNAVAGDSEDPDVTAFLGWEWSQVGLSPETHYGHRNIVLAHTDDARIPLRPIGAPGPTTSGLTKASPAAARRLLALQDRDPRYRDLARFLRERAAAVACEEGVPVRRLPADCVESAQTPEELFRKLDEWGHEAIVIPHGTTWGSYTPPGADWQRQLSSGQHDPKWQTLFEVYSGHGSAELYRDWGAIRSEAPGAATCPKPTASYLPTCWRAGEIIRARCKAAGRADSVCEERAQQARRHAVAAGAGAHQTVPGVRSEEWLDAGQCRDCFLPAFNYRPTGSLQYILALRSFEDPARPQGLRMGVIASSDNHTARPGTGYKEVDRREMTEAAGRIGAARARAQRLRRTPPVGWSRSIESAERRQGGAVVGESERQASFFFTGGLVAVHAAGRHREAIWEALQRREVYGTSGPRILLWFDLLHPEDGSALPMGSETKMVGSPQFRVRALGSLEQLPGCPDYSIDALSPERLRHLCRGECYNPGDQRRVIARVEVVRIRPQNRPGEPMAALIQDPWRVLPCAPDPAGCQVRFGDEEFSEAGRDALYYVRAIETPSPAINGDTLRCEFDSKGDCIAVDLCWGDDRTPYQEDCLAETEERAWSSPIFVSYGPADSSE